jgi:hypothetical protein
MGVKLGLSHDGRNIRPRDLENRMLSTIFGPEKKKVIKSLAKITKSLAS